MEFETFILYSNIAQIFSETSFPSESSSENFSWSPEWCAIYLLWTRLWRYVFLSYCLWREHVKLWELLDTLVNINNMNSTASLQIICKIFRHQCSSNTKLGSWVKPYRFSHWLNQICNKRQWYKDAYCVWTYLMLSKILLINNTDKFLYTNYPTFIWRWASAFRKVQP